MTDRGQNNRVTAVLGALLAGFLAPLHAIEPPGESTPVAAKTYRLPDLHISQHYLPLGQLPGPAAAEAQQRLSAIGVAPGGGRLDARGARWGTLILNQPLFPGKGAGNRLRWPASAAPPRGRALERHAWEAFKGYVAARGAVLRIDVEEFSPEGRAVAHRDGEMVQIHAPRVVDGVPVRDSFVSAVVNQGNLVLMGAHRWGDVETAAEPGLTSEQAVEIAHEYLQPLTVSGFRGRPRLVFLPLSRGRDPGEIVVGRGYEYRLAWVVKPVFEDDAGNWELLVDAHGGEVLSFEDTIQYAATREVSGGVFPFSNDGLSPDGLEQAAWPVPSVRVANGTATLTTDAGGNLPLCLDDTISSSLEGPYVRINDNCGPIGLSSTGNIDFGTGSGTDCATPGFGGAGNTHAARSGFYELNRISAMARGQIPANVWLQQQLTANMNDVNLNCNATWNGSAVNFSRSGGGCSNTGELAAVVDHEWGHGMDHNDVATGVSTPGEGIADLYAYLRLDTSCIARGFTPGVGCGGFFDPCIDCDGVRDIDWAMRASGQPHDVVWIDANCPTTTGGTPCGGSTHCEGAVYAEAVYDLVNRDLPSLYGMDHHAALELGTRLTYVAAGPVVNWFQCVTEAPFYGGCNADGGYLNYLAADDDNGNLADGTPHMSAIFAAFDRHGIACDVPAVKDSGCTDTPASAPNVSATAIDRGAVLSWGAVAGAASYDILRTDGVFGCNFGKTRIAATQGLTFVDTGLRNGRTYSYVVVPKGGGDMCLGPASGCTEVTPQAGSNLAITFDTDTIAGLTGDDDGGVDNCEVTRLSFEISNIGLGTLSNPRILNVSSTSHPSSVAIISSSFSVDSPSVEQCGSVKASFDFIAEGLSRGDTLEFLVEVTADDLAVPRTGKVYVTPVEIDVFSHASTTFSFESGAEDWTVVEGTFGRTDTGGGAQGTAFYRASSADLPEQCDQIRSPPLRLSPTSTLEMWTRFDIEPVEVATKAWWDRANIGVRDVRTGTRVSVDPDTGRLYNASGEHGTCGTEGQNGWADTEDAWAASGWSPSALGADGHAGNWVQLDIRYGTDALLHGFGFRFDQVTLTDVEVAVDDILADICLSLPAGIQVSPNALSISEGTGSGSFTVTPTNAPTADVTLALHSRDTGECTVPAEVTFPATTNWQTGVDVTVTGVDDTLADGDQPCVVDVRVSSSADPKYHSGLDAAQVLVTVGDDEVAEACGGNQVKVENLDYQPGVHSCSGSTSIFAGPAVTVLNGAEVTYISPQIVLASGFEVIRGGTFRAVAP